MAREASIVVGSGINPLKKLVPDNHITGEKHLIGTQIVCTNPEDSSAGITGLTTQMAVSTSAVKIPTTPLKYRRAISIFNMSSSNYLFIGFDSSVSTGDGYPIPALSSFPMDINGDLEIWGIAGSSVDVRIIEVA